MTNSITKPRRGRPPKHNRENDDTRELLIRSGLEYFTEYGYSSSGIDQIMKKVGVPKGSFYYYFSSKEAFGLVVIETYANYFKHKLNKWLLDETELPLKRLKNFAEDAKLGMAKHQFQRGCLVGNLEQEVNSLPDSFPQLLQDIFLSWQESVSACLETAKQHNELSSKANSHELAEFFWIGWEGAVSRAKLFKSANPLDNYLAYYIASLPK